MGYYKVSICGLEIGSEHVIPSEMTIENPDGIEIGRLIFDPRYCEKDRKEHRSYYIIVPEDESAIKNARADLIEFNGLSATRQGVERA